MELHGAAKRIFGGLNSRLLKQARFGHSKHQAKQDAREARKQKYGTLAGYNPAKVNGIFSVRTMENYRKAMESFSAWLAERGVKNAAQITPELAGSYLQARRGCSPWTVSLEMSAINKALGYSLDKKSLGLEFRHKEEITRSRTETLSRRFSQYQDQITVIRGTGIRRQSVLNITPADCIYNRNGEVAGVRVVEKGGKQRVAPVLNAFKKDVTAIVERAEDRDKPLFSKLDSHVPCHRYRGEYCKNLLSQLSDENAQGRPWFGGDLDPRQYIHLRGRDAKVGDTYRGHPTKVVAAVSGAMGHNRLEIIFNNYLYGD